MNPKEYVLQLFVTGKGSESIRAFQNVKQFCDQRLAGRYQLWVIDVLIQPERAGDGKRAKRHADAALRRANELSASFDAARIRLLLAGFDGQDPASRETLLREVETVFERCGAEAYLRRTREAREAG